MKRSHKLLLAALILLLALAVILFPRLKLTKNTDGVAELLRKERLSSDYSSVISFTGSCTTGKADDLVLLWFSIQNPDDPDFVTYQAADCRLWISGAGLPQGHGGHEKNLPHHLDGQRHLSGRRPGLPLHRSDAASRVRPVGDHAHTGRSSVYLRIHSALRPV